MMPSLMKLVLVAEAGWQAGQWLGAPTGQQGDGKARAGSPACAAGSGHVPLPQPAPVRAAAGCSICDGQSDGQRCHVQS